VFAVDTMKEVGRVPVPDGWLGLTWSPDGRRVYVGGGSRGRVYEFTFSTAGELKPSREFALVEGEATKDDFVGDVKISPDGQNAYVAMLYRDGIAVVNLQSGKETARHKTGRRPYRIVFHPDGKIVFRIELGGCLGVSS
jgi:DNA-binding beta-propeller fold protein YncE